MRSVALLTALFIGAALNVAGQYTWKNVHTGAGGGFIPGVIFNQKQKGLAFLRTDIGGAYKLNADGITWSPLLDFADNARADYWGVESIATDPVNTQNLYIEVGLYTNFWDPNNGTLLISNNQGSTFKAVPLPFKVGGNMPGRGAGERLVIDPNNNSVLYLGARSGHGLYKSTDSGNTWNRVQSLNATGDFVIDPTDTSGYNSDPIGVGWIIFDTTSPKIAAGTSRIFVGVETKDSPSIWVTNDAGVTWAPVPGQDTTYLTHKAVLSPAEKSLYVTYVDTAGPWDGSHGWIGKYNISSSTWTNVTPAQAIADNSYGFGGISVDLSGKPGTVMAASLNEYYPDAQIWRSLDGGASWSVLYSASYPAPDYQLLVTRYYGWDISSAPWIQSYTTDSKQIGWGIEGLAIDPFDSNHFLYGTGLTLYGSHNLLQWDTVHNITLENASNGVEETAVLSLISPPSGAHLLSAVGDIGGWTHDSLDVAPSTLHTPIFGTDQDIDYAGLKPNMIVRIGNAAGQIATSGDGGHTWALYANAPSLSGGNIQYSANATAILWASSSGVFVAKNNGTFVASTGIPTGAIIKADKANDAYFYGTSGGWIYVSTDSGASFTKVNLLGSATSANGIAVNTLGTAGEFWVSTAVGLWHSKDFGHTIIGLSGNLSQAWAISVGAPATTGGTPTLFAAAVVSNVYGIFRSDNGGGSWIQINDAAHGFVTTSSAVVCGDPRIYKRVYIGTNGRGITYGN
ncbi:hypothetical protein FRB94_004006 [Tulasnella sp. JGI-2019a]|nr:hypothetical protein FRB93_003340 [Tulasnella sp. JGI-2019a]KAG9002264.1 hypothetical protein FRB94_004006 [Tulasnella sp. JGI-2019a]KAG9032852.1 hypothetical protein FRB95_000936 [Tulasnella sp. JGI-2019a]